VQLLAAGMRDDRQLGREALDVLRLALEVAHGDEHREVQVLVSGGLEHRVQLALDVLPQGVAVRPDDEAAAHRAEVDELGPVDDVVVPTAEVLGLRGESLRLRHGVPAYQGAGVPAQVTSNGTSRRAMTSSSTPPSTSSSHRAR